MDRRLSAQAYKERLVATGLCVQCVQPHSRGTYRCADCQRKNTLYIRQRRQATQTVQCSLCLSIGHKYESCDLNPDSYL